MVHRRAPSWLSRPDVPSPRGPWRRSRARGKPPRARCAVTARPPAARRSGCPVARRLGADLVECGAEHGCGQRGPVRCASMVESTPMLLHGFRAQGGNPARWRGGRPAAGRRVTRWPHGRSGRDRGTAASARRTERCHSASRRRMCWPGARSVFGSATIRQPAPRAAAWRGPATAVAWPALTRQPDRHASSAHAQASAALARIIAGTALARHSADQQRSGSVSDERPESNDAGRGASMSPSGPVTEPRSRTGRAGRQTRCRRRRPREPGGRILDADGPQPAGHGVVSIDLEPGQLPASSGSRPRRRGSRTAAMRSSGSRRRRPADPDTTSRSTPRSWTRSSSAEAKRSAGSGAQALASSR